MHQPPHFNQTQEDQIFTLFLNGLNNTPGFQFSSYCAKFGKLRTNLQRMNFVYRDTEKLAAYPTFKQDEKSDSESTKVREQGNQLYKAGNYREASERYTMSLLKAKSNEMRVLAYGNRSAALFQMQLYSECLKDIDRAFNTNYPEELKAKLVARQKLANTGKGIKLRFHEPVPKILESERNPHIPCAKDCIKMVKDERYGRHILATRDIEIGEIIAVEPSYCAMIENGIYVHCHECFELCYSMIPCEKCTKALYCSKTCQDKAFDTYHQYECPILLTLDLVKVDFPKRLALKVAFKSKDEWDVDSSDQRQETDDDMYLSERFKEINNLLSHTEKRTVENVLARTTVACAFFHLIKNHTSFLRDYANEDRLKEMLLSMVLVCGVNTVDLNELSHDAATSPYGFQSYELTPIAAALYSFFSMFSHSCWPNVARHFYGSSMVLRACSTIKQGEQCFVCYGPRYPFYSQEFRQNFLTGHRFFTCTCRPCKENWSTSLEPRGQLNMVDKFVMMRLKTTADISVAKSEVGKLLKQAKKAERTLPPGQDYFVQDLLTFCYNIFGNKKLPFG